MRRTPLFLRNGKVQRRLMELTRGESMRQKNVEECFMQRIWDWKTLFRKSKVCDQYDPDKRCRPKSSSFLGGEGSRGGSVGS